MKKYLCLLIIILFSCNNHDENKIAIVIHGGAGIILKENISMEFNTPGMYRAYVNKYGKKKFSSIMNKLFNF